MKLSIITSYFNGLQYIKELARYLEPQLNDNVEWIIIDDGCHEKELDNLKAKVIHLEENSGCAGIPRNYGLDVAQGEYITFIDCDDCVPDYFVKKILNKIVVNPFDYCLMSWKRMDGAFTIDVRNGRPDWNCSVWGIVYKRENIGGTRFSDKKIAEDYEFNQKCLKGKEEKITDIMYYYRINPNGLTQTYIGG